MSMAWTRRRRSTGPRYFPKQGKVLAEGGVPDAVKRRPRRQGPRDGNASEPLGGGQAIAIDREHGMLVGGSDPRKDGFALGYLAGASPGLPLTNDFSISASIGPGKCFARGG